MQKLSNDHGSYIACKNYQYVLVLKTSSNLDYIYKRKVIKTFKKWLKMGYFDRFDKKAALWKNVTCPNVFWWSWFLHNLYLLTRGNLSANFKSLGKGFVNVRLKKCLKIVKLAKIEPTDYFALSEIIKNFLNHFMF